MRAARTECSRRVGLVVGDSLNDEALMALMLV